MRKSRRKVAHKSFFFQLIFFRLEKWGVAQIRGILFQLEPVLLSPAECSHHRCMPRSKVQLGAESFFACAAQGSSGRPSSFTIRRSPQGCASRVA
jgi:hypothetical protein